ncbi:LacI family transcriptional regulator [Rhizobium sp. RCAM05350]|nr:LacI family transcriptional regulator [Rhizobium sp. RCAM05350]
MAETEASVRRTPPTIKTLADLTGYSIATISKALRDSPVVAQATKDAIFKAAQDIGYQANARGMALRTGKTYQAAVLMPVTAVRDYRMGRRRIHSDSQRHQPGPGRLRLPHIRACHPTPRTAVTWRAGSWIRGWPTGSSFPAFWPTIRASIFWSKAAFPFVSLGRCRKPLVYAHVDIDNEWAAFAATERLIAGGHRRIALINPQRPLSYAMDRIDGFARAFGEAGLETPTDLIAEGDLSTLFGRKALELLQRPEPLDGLHLHQRIHDARRPVGAWQPRPAGRHRYRCHRL